jgi:hypothetical protein
LAVKNAVHINNAAQPSPARMRGKNANGTTAISVTPIVAQKIGVPTRSARLRDRGDRGATLSI